MNYELLDQSRLRHRVGVIGAGLMGRGIAAVCAIAGLHVTVVDQSASALDSVERTVEVVHDELAKSGANVATPSQPACATSLSALADADIVFEAVFEDVFIKRAVYAELETLLPPATILASTTSSFLPTALARELCHRERFIVAHFWNPPHAINLVEVVPGDDTVQATLDTMLSFLLSIGMRPIVVKREIPGFIGNRIQFAVLREAMHLVREGVASPDDVDVVIRESLGPRYAIAGPLENADLAGLDTFLRIAEYLVPELAHGSDAVEVLRELVGRGRTGARSGGGFYEWTPDRASSAIALRNHALLHRRAESSTC